MVRIAAAAATSTGAATTPAVAEAEAARAEGDEHEEGDDGADDDPREGARGETLAPRGLALGGARRGAAARRGRRLARRAGRGPGGVGLDGGRGALGLVRVRGTAQGGVAN